MTFVVSSLAEWSEFLDSLERLLGDADDHVALSCGCIVSESLLRRKLKKQLALGESPHISNIRSLDMLLKEGSFECPVCSQSVVQTGPVEQLRQVARQITQKRHELDLRVLAPPAALDIHAADDSSSLPSSHLSPASWDSEFPTNVDVSLLDTPAIQPKAGLLTLLRQAATQVSPPQTASSSPPNSSNQENTPQLSHSLSYTSVDTRPLQSSADEEFREYNFSKSFPVYRKQFIHSTRQAHSGILSRNPTARINYSANISPDGSKFVLLGKKKWHVYSVSDDYNDPPISIYNASTDDEGACFVAMSDSLVVLAGQTSGTIRAYDSSANFKLVYHHNTGFGIHCLAVSHQNTVAVGIVGRDKNNQNQPMIVLHYLGMAPSSYSSTQSDDVANSPTSVVSGMMESTGLLDAKVITVTSPYRDPITTLSFSNDDCYLCCSTYAESRFIVISIMNPLEPRLVMKSSRRMDIDQDYEGITSVRFFPHNPRYMAITSVATAAPPIILDNKLGSLTTAVSSSNSNSAGVQTIAATTTNPNKVSSSASSSASGITNRPSVMMKVDKVGTQIHRVEVSPRGDAMAFLDKSGLVYIMSCPGLLSDFKRIAICADVANANAGYRHAAAMRFTPNGQVLLLVDRKGYLHIEDFGAGLPHQAGMGKCRILA